MARSSRVSYVHSSAERMNSEVLPGAFGFRVRVSIRFYFISPRRVARRRPRAVLRGGTAAWKLSRACALPPAQLCRWTRVSCRGNTYARTPPARAHALLPRAQRDATTACPIRPATRVSSHLRRAPRGAVMHGVERIVCSASYQQTTPRTLKFSFPKISLSQPVL
jgi:hypothetical protein